MVKQTKSSTLLGRKFRFNHRVLLTAFGIVLLEWNVNQYLQYLAAKELRSHPWSDEQKHGSHTKIPQILRQNAASLKPRNATGFSSQSMYPRPAAPVLEDDNQRLSIKEFKEIQDLSTWDYPRIDVVYTWVNGSDTSWQREKAKHHHKFLEELLGHAPAEKDAQGDKRSSNGDNRFRDREELKYSLRSVDRYAPWVGKIFIVVADGQVPRWLNTSHPKIQVIPHSQIFRESSHLPTFNSCSIEANLVNIPGLSEYFIYFNDDTFLGKSIRPSDFFWSETRGTHRVFVEDFDFRSGGCAPKCPKEKLGNKMCDASCNVSDCGWDMGDCGQATIESGMKQIELERKKPRHFPTAKGDFLTTLKYVDGLYNRVFGKSRGKEERRQGQHVPFLMSKHMLSDVIGRFPDEFNETSSHRFRHPRDMQFTFSYIYYIEAVRVYAPSRRQIWYAALDTMKANEPFLYGVPRFPMEQNEVERRNRIEKLDSYSKLKECTRAYHDKKLETSAIPGCIDSVENLYKEGLRLPANEFHLETDRDYHLILFKNNMAFNRLELSNLVRWRRKFNTVNDDSTVPLAQLNKGIQAMYETLLPDSSPYEKNFAGP